MKNQFIIAAIVALTVISCNNKTEGHGHDHSDQTHQHNEDSISSSNAAQQVEFDASNSDVEKDSVIPAHDHSAPGHQH